MQNIVFKILKPRCKLEIFVMEIDMLDFVVLPKSGPMLVELREIIEGIVTEAVLASKNYYRARNMEWDFTGNQEESILEATICLLLSYVKAFYYPDQLTDKDLRDPNVKLIVTERAGPKDINNCTAIYTVSFSGQRPISVSRVRMGYVSKVGQYVVINRTI